MLKLLTAAILMTASMANAKVLEINTIEEAREMFKQDKPTIVMFGASWCPACRDAKPAFIEAERLYKGKVVFAYIDVDKVDLRRFQLPYIPSYMATKSMGREQISALGSLNQLESRDVEGLKKYIKEFTNIAP